jgi:hypothetical protein
LASNSRISRRLVRQLIAALLFAAGASAPRIAAASELYTDIDRDGISDVVSIQSVPSTGLRVWLSKSNVTFVLPTRRPITHVAASDLDGDGHIDLIAADSAAKVHVWHRTPRGHLRPTRPRRSPWRDAISTSRVGRGCDDGPGPALDDGSSTAAVTDLGPARHSNRAISKATPTAAAAPVSTGARLPRDPRGPPTA